MGLRSAVDPYNGDEDTIVDELVGNAYGRVKIVADNLPLILRLAQSLDESNLIPNIGIKGDKGDPGDTGDTGPQGERGDRGDVGLQGPRGDIGPRGYTGDKGDKGNTGLKGDEGPTGPRGFQGLSGNDGRGISDIAVDGSNHFIITFTDGTSLDLGVIAGTTPAPVAGTLDFSLPGNSGQLGILGILGYQTNYAGNSALDFTDPNNSSLITLIAG